MEDFLTQLVQALLSALSVVFDDFPLQEWFERWFDGRGGGSAQGVWILILGAALAVLALLAFLWLLRRVPPKLREGGAPPLPFIDPGERE